MPRALPEPPVPQELLVLREPLEPQGLLVLQEQLDLPVLRARLGRKVIKVFRVCKGQPEQRGLQERPA